MRPAAPIARNEARRAPSAGFRADVQGLRAVAVGLVLLYHANFPFLRGGFVGVDVFFVISGYLITGLLLREALATGRIDLAGFYARRIRRILPAATIVLVATLALTLLLLPPIRWQQIGIEAGGAALYVVNWIFAANTDYLNADVAASPIQHFWTLSVEEQFYIVWPLLLILLLLVLRARARRTGSALSAERVLRVAGVGVLLILVPSLIWSIVYTASSPAPAYFVTTTRLWELAIGAALAVFAARLERMPDWLGYLIGWAGLAGILATGLFYTSTTPAFPGYAALLPTLSTAAVIAGGLGGRATRGAGAILSLRPMRWVGDISYSLYLWHWPLVVVGTYLLGGELRFRWGLVIVILAFLPAWLSYRFIETPFRGWKRLAGRPAPALWSGAAMVACTVIGATAVSATPKLLTPQTDLGGRPLGAEALSRDFEDDSLQNFTDAGEPVHSVEGGFIPSAIDARKDVSVIYRMGCNRGNNDSKPKGCVFGDEQSETTVVLVGDSHAVNWTPTMIELAERNGWRLVTHTKAACAFADAPQARNGRAYPQCDAWNTAVAREIERVEPDLVITANTTRAGMLDGGVPAAEDRRVELYTEALGKRWQRLEDAGIPLIVMKDTPRMKTDVPECLSKHPERVSKCATSRDRALDDRVFPELTAAEGRRGVEVIDMNNWVCPEKDACAAVVGNVVVWRDSHHLTKTFAESLVNPLEAKLRESRLAEPILF